ncbi:hypothetical protein Ancab_032863 [Ancistrocladus abbreviatus]
MEGPSYTARGAGSTAAKRPTTSIPTPPLHTHELLGRTPFNRAFAAVYLCAILALLCHHIIRIMNSTTYISFLLSLLFLIADAILAFQWACTQSFRMRPIRRREFLENLEKIITKKSDHPAVDIFICTADPYKEPPLGVVDTALSVMAYDYPVEKISVYISDDGGSELTLFAFMEAAKFARHWLPFCRRNNTVERAPQAYFRSNYTSSSDSEYENIKTMYESMKVKVENVVDKGKVGDEYIFDEKERQAFSEWATPHFTRQDHPTIIKVLLNNCIEKDSIGHSMPNLIYLSREKSKTQHHHFKAGALNTLVRVSAVMTNAPIILTLDCDTLSNDPQTIKRALCYFSDRTIYPTLGFVQFPQIFGGLNKEDIYSSEHKRLFQINPLGMDGLLGPNYVGAGCFFQRRALFGSPSSFIQPEIVELSPDHLVERPFQADVLTLAHRVASCNYERQTHWGTKLGFRYGSLVEDYYTGYRLQSEGWNSIFCHPDRPAFLGDSPVALIDLLGQCKRWCIGLLEVLFSKYSTITYGVRSMGLLMGLAYSHYACWGIWSIPIAIYAFIPQLALLNGISTFPKATYLWFFLYLFLFIGANLQDLLDYVVANGTIQRWWNCQRMWMISGLSSFLFGCLEFSLKSFGIAMPGFSLTAKVQEDELSKRYEQGTYEFGVPSPLFVPMTMAAIINLITLVIGSIMAILRGRISEELVMQILLSGFVAINCWPIYQAIALRSDKGRMPTKVTLIAMCLTILLCIIVGIILQAS